MHTLPETLDLVEAAAENKSAASARTLLLKSFLAGLFIAFAAVTSTIVSASLLADPATYGLGKLLQGLVFSGGLIFVVLTSSELFTGNSLMFAALLDGRLSPRGLLRNWGLVYLGNFLGAFFLVLLVLLSGIYAANSGELALTLASFAEKKSALSFGTAFFLGLLCNLLVCLAVWLAFSAKTFTAKLLACVLPVTFFIICGFEHSVANMFYLPAGAFLGAQVSLWALLLNLFSVTLGNIFGGCLLAAIFRFTIRDKNAKISICKTPNITPTLPNPTQPKKSQSPKKSRKKPSPKAPKSPRKQP